MKFVSVTSDTRPGPHWLRVQDVCAYMCEERLAVLHVSPNHCLTSPSAFTNKPDWYLRVRPRWGMQTEQRSRDHTSAHTHTHKKRYLQPVSLSLLMALDRRRTQPRKPAPCFLWIFLWFQTLMVMESAFPMYLTWEETEWKKTDPWDRKGDWGQWKGVYNSAIMHRNSQEQNETLCMGFRGSLDILVLTKSFQNINKSH